MLCLISPALLYNKCKIEVKWSKELFRKEDLISVDIKEIIVVEGKDDTTAVKRAVHADTIETNGSAISEETIRHIQHAQDVRGVIVFTDPDYPGRRIRAIIEAHVAGVKHAFLPKKKAIAKNGKSLGIEHASDEDIRYALSKVYTPQEIGQETPCPITLDDLITAKLLSHPDAQQRRERLGELLNIGSTNGKQLVKRLKMFQITEKQFGEAIAKINQEERNA